MKADLRPLLYWVGERESMRREKEDLGLPYPWSGDPILNKYRFCNVRREDDRVTRWIADNIRKPYAGHRFLWLMLCIARQINWPPTLQALMTSGPRYWPRTNAFRPEAVGERLDQLAAEMPKLYTGAYMISAPQEKGASKNKYIAEEVIGGLWTRHRYFTATFASKWHPITLERTARMIRRTKGWGVFMSYQAVVDMRFTALLDTAADRSRWASAGPGTLRGLNRLHGRPVRQIIDQRHALAEMRAIYPVVKAATGVDMDFSDVPNILCEVDKYLRVKNGEGTPRALYVPGRGW